jgi:hypothetical protein
MHASLGASHGQTPAAGMRCLLSGFAASTLDLQKSADLLREKTRKTALMVKYPG